jgi:hypothetical protein
MELSLDEENRSLGKPVRDHLGQHLRDYYQELIGDSLPADLVKLMQRLERTIQARSEPPDPKSMAELMNAVLLVDD